MAAAVTKNRNCIAVEENHLLYISGKVHAVAAITEHEKRNL